MLGLYDDLNSVLLRRRWTHQFPRKVLVDFSRRIVIIFSGFPILIVYVIVYVVMCVCLDSSLNVFNLLFAYTSKLEDSRVRALSDLAVTV